QLEAPRGGIQGGGHGLSRFQVWEVRSAVPVEHMFEVARGRARAIGAIRAVALVGLTDVNRLRVLPLVLISDRVALIVIAVADQSTEDASGIRGIEDAALLRLPVPGGDVFLADGALEGVFGMGNIVPSLDAGKH